MGKNNSVLFVIAPGNFRDEEYFEPKKILEEANYKVTTASIKLGEFVGKLGGTVNVDILLSEVYALDYDGIVYIGGSGIVALWDDRRLQDLAKIFFDKDLIVSAICSAPIILANAGLLTGKKATCFHTDDAHLRNGGAEYTGNTVEIDGKIITGSGPEAAKEFGSVLVKELDKLQKT